MGGKLPPYAVAESDGTPTVYQPWKIIFPNGTITDVGDGTVYVGIGTSIETTTSVTVSTLDARTPILLAGTIISILTNGLANNFFRGDGTYSTLSTPIVYSPTGGYYIVQSNNTSLPNSQQLASLNAGLLKNASTTGVLSIATPDIDYQLPVSASSPILLVGDTIGIQAAGAGASGYLSQSNFNLFNAKASTSTSITTVSPLSGGGDLSTNRVISLTTDGNTANFLNGNGVFTTPSGGSSIVYAPTGGYYIVQSNNTNIPNSQQLASLITGLVKNTSATGVLSIGSGGIDYENLITVASPVLRRVDGISILTDGSTTNYLRGDGSYHSPFEFRSPLLSSGTVVSITTDGSTTNFQRGDGTLAVPSSNSGVKLIVFTVYSSTTWTGEKIPIFQAPFETPITIRQVNATVSGGASPELGFNIEHRDWGGLGISGTNLFVNIQSANATGFQAVSFTSANVAAKAHLLLASSAVIAGNVDYITGVIYYTRDSI